MISFLTMALVAVVSAQLAMDRTDYDLLVKVQSDWGAICDCRGHVAFSDSAAGCSMTVCKPIARFTICQDGAPIVACSSNGRLVALCDLQKTPSRNALTLFCLFNRNFPSGALNNGVLKLEAPFTALTGLYVWQRSRFNCKLTWTFRTIIDANNFKLLDAKQGFPFEMLPALQFL